MVCSVLAEAWSRKSCHGSLGAETWSQKPWRGKPWLCWAVLDFACFYLLLLGFAGLSFKLGRLRKAKQSRAVHVFVDRCALRSPARSGLNVGLGHVRLMLGSWAFWGQFFFVFGRICVRSGVLKGFFSISDRFWEDFGSIWEGIWEDFAKIFGIFFGNADLQNSCAHAVFRKGRAVKNLQKIENNHIKN